MSDDSRAPLLAAHSSTQFSGGASYESIPSAPNGGALPAHLQTQRKRWLAVWLTTVRAYRRGLKGFGGAPPQPFLPPPPPAMCPGVLARAAHAERLTPLLSVQTM